MEYPYKSSLLFLHVPKWKCRYPLIGEHLFILYLPMGLFAVADAADRSGRSVRIVHLGIEYIRGGDTDPCDHVRQKSPRVVAFDLQWHYQLPDVIEAARQVKHAFPEKYILLGGLTASYFHKQLMEKFPFIDGILRGEAEGPIVQFLDAIEGRLAMTEVPNLSWRGEEGIHVNPIGFIATSSILAERSFTRFDLLDHADVYVRSVKCPWFWSKDMGHYLNYKFLLPKENMFPLMTVRGCESNCSFCGGSRYAMKQILGRHRITMRPIPAVLQSVAEAHRIGYDVMHAEACPVPENQEYYVHLVQKIGNKFPNVGMILESRHLPSPALIKAFGKAFPNGRKRSTICLSPESADEEVRRRNKGYFYSNEAFERTLELMRQYGVKTQIFFMFGLPGETLKSLDLTEKMIKKLKYDSTPAMPVHVDRAVLDPGCQIAEQPEPYDAVLATRSLEDFIALHTNDDPSWNINIGYGIKGVFPQLNPSDPHFVEDYDQILKYIECSRFCRLQNRVRNDTKHFWFTHWKWFLNTKLDYSQAFTSIFARTSCRLMDTLWKLKR